MRASSDSARAAAQHQRGWFQRLRAEVAAGAPLALVNADAPQEILRAMDVPYVVNQWWSALVASRGRAGESLEAVRALGLPDDSRQYDAVGLGSRSLEDPPWGGLPRPDLVVAEKSGDAGRKVFDAWAEHEGSAFFCFERTHPAGSAPRWWDLVPERWEEVFGADRLDLMVAENEEFVDWVTEHTGRRLDLDRLVEVMAHVDAQAEWNRRTRDLVAAVRPMPVSLHESVNSVMIPQWHRGTAWAVEAAARFNAEVRAAVDAGHAVCPGERRRLMWVGRGLWHDMDLYRHFEESHGAVFVWSMYLAIAADGYVRRGPDPMRALAARFTGFTDQLYLPGWAEGWYVKEAQAHGVDAVVHLVADDVPGPAFVTSALRDAGFPVLELHASNADPRALSHDVLVERIGGLLDDLAPG